MRTVAAIVHTADSFIRSLTDLTGSSQQLSHDACNAVRASALFSPLFLHLGSLMLECSPLHLNWIL